VRAAIVTCGGLCPGLNDVVRQVIGRIANIFLLLFLQSDAILVFQWFILLTLFKFTDRPHIGSVWSQRNSRDSVWL